MVKRFLLLAFVLPIVLFAQEKEQIVKKGLLRTTGTISFGQLTNHQQTNLYLTGNTEYFTNEHITARGDIYYYLKSGDKQMLNQNHQLFAGASYHINSTSKFVPYIGIQPGIAITQSNEVSIDMKNNVTVTPLISSVTGFNYFASKWFHLFIDGRYVAGKHTSNHTPISLNEFRLSFGLGFNLNVLTKN
ncbi:MAG: hypothetical protein H6589_05975 [Flavobacteriales bacterium]|nr:hypothetical protein [Flavobacteriales bacterium]